MLASLSALPTSVRAEVYRCVIGGTAVYQDSPCPGGRAIATVPVKKTVTAPPQASPEFVPGTKTRIVAAEATPGGRRGYSEINRDLQSAIEAQSALQQQYDTAYLEFRRRWAQTQFGDGPPGLKQEFNQRWDPKLKAASDKVRTYVDEIGKVCRDGTPRPSGGRCP